MPAYDPEVLEVLATIVELGYVSVARGTMTDVVPPRGNLFTSGEQDRWTPTTRYIAEYAANHPDWSGEFFVCIYDGWREYSEPADEAQRHYVRWKDVDRGRFLGTGSMGEPRFRHQHDDIRIYPVLPRPVLTYDRHTGDRNALLIPDYEFVQTRYASFLQQVAQGDIPWEQKAAKLVWRGRRHVSDGYAHFDHGMGPQHPRDVAFDFSRRPDLAPVFDAAFEPTPVAWMLRHRYILDMDGMSGSWSGCYWKLSSNSLVWRVRSYWEQWYHDRLQPGRHYVVLKDFHSVRDLFCWCEENEDKCRAMVAAANRVMREMTYEYAVSGYAIR
jgi:hypothetical protein